MTEKDCEKCKINYYKKVENDNKILGYYFILITILTVLLFGIYQIINFIF